MDKKLRKKILEGVGIGIASLIVYTIVAYLLELLRVAINKMPIDNIDIHWLIFPILFFSAFSTWAWFDAKEDKDEEDE